MKKRIPVFVLMLLILYGIAVPASAQEIPDPGRTGNLTITMNWDGKPLNSGSLSLLQVGTIAQTDGNYSFVLIPPLESTGISLDNLQDPDLARQLASKAAEKKLTPITAEIVSGSAKFQGLKPGLYVVTQSQNQTSDGFAPIQPFLISLPRWENGTYVYNVSAAPKVPLETEPVAPTEPTQPKPTEPELPQTGQTNWPIPMLAVLGLVFLVTGLLLRSGKRDDREK